MRVSRFRFPGGYRKEEIGEEASEVAGEFSGSGENSQSQTECRGVPGAEFSRVLEAAAGVNNLVSLQILMRL